MARSILPSRFSFLTLVLLAHAVLCQILTFDFREGAGLVPLFTKDSGSVQILVSSSDHEGVVRVAKDLALDFGRTTGTNGTVVTSTDKLNNSSSNGIVIIGTLGKSPFIDSLVSKGSLQTSAITGKWEAYLQQVVANPLEGNGNNIASALVIAGSDKRGSIYGVYDLSESIGVSPWHFWADVPYKKRTAVYADPAKSPRIQDSPSVQYRGLFINDEWQLIAWAAGKFPTSANGGSFTSQFYVLVFELLLRLKANYLWPGMKKSASFYRDDKENGRLADVYGIVMGTSHHEPMARPYIEQRENLTGPWDWSKNKVNITQFMRDGVQRSKGWETLYTMGMRGEGEDAASPTLTAPQLEEIIGVQQGIMEEVLGKPVSAVPHAWTLYKEVGKYWQAGMNISEHVTLLWTDDNYGNLLRVPLVNETSRAGGAGVYYHFGYYGQPRSYEWVYECQFAKTWEQMQLAYEKKERKLWIANVQDIKGFEAPATHFLDMAYDMSKYQTPQSTTDFLQRWSKREFGSGIETATAQIINTYGRLTIRRKFETLTMEPFAYSTLYYDAALRVLKEWEDLSNLAQKTYDSLDAATKPAFFQMVLYHVKAGKSVVELYVKAELGKLYRDQQRTSTNRLASEASAAFAADASMTSQYHSLLNSKWNKVMSNAHLGYTEWKGPSKNIMPPLVYVSDSTAPATGILGIAVQGSNASSTAPANKGVPLKMISMDPYMPKGEQRYLDIFTTKNGTFSYKITANASYISFTNPSGALTAPGATSDARSVITIDWASAPSGSSYIELKVTTSSSTPETVTAILPLMKTSVPTTFKGHIESNRVLLIEAAHYHSSNPGTNPSASLIELPWYGKSFSAIKLWPVTLPGPLTTSTAPSATYPIYTFTSTKAAKIEFFLGASLNHDPTRPLLLAYAVDGGTPVVKRVLADYPGGSTPSGWSGAVVNTGWSVTVSGVDLGKEGGHEISLWLLEVGVVVEKMIVDLGGFRASGLGPWEAFRQE